MLIPENTSRKLDGLGRITLPKGLRDRMGVNEFELFTAVIDGRYCVVLAAPENRLNASLKDAVMSFVHEHPEYADKFLNTLGN